MQSFGDFNSDLTKDNQYQIEIIPCPYEQTTSYEQGTSNGPKAIIEASQELEFYDDEFGFDPSQVGIKTLKPIEMPLQNQNTEKPFEALENSCRAAYDNNKFPIVLGGEHSLSLGSVKAAYQFLRDQGKQMTLLHFDAHADLRDEYMDNPYNHACAIHSIYKACPGIKIVSVGIRNISEGEVTFLKELQNKVNENLLEEMPIDIFYARDEFHKTYNYREAIKEFKEDIGAAHTSKKLSPGSSHKFWNSKDVIDTLVKCGNSNVYITFDVDGFDSGIMPATGTPEPGGLDWYTPVNIIKECFEKFDVIGADIVELSPIEKFHAPDFLVAKLIYKIIACKVKKSKFAKIS